MIREIKPYLYEIKVRLPRSPLKNLNSYVIVSGGRNLLIDTGFNQPECLEDLRAGIAELGLDLDNTDLLATHFHADHSGLIDQIVRPGRRVYIGEVDKVLLEASFSGEGQRTLQKDQFLQEGFPGDLLEQALLQSPARNFAAKTPVPLTPLVDGQILTVGEVTLRCIHSPGHTPGHICLYNEADRFMVLGDHVLFDITPNITAWPSLPNSLACYLRSLRMIAGYDVVLPLPGHRQCHCTMAQRVDQLLAHHENRLEDTRRIIGRSPGICGYDVAGEMPWSIRARNWDDFPLPQKWFAVGETLAHLNYLVDRGEVRREIKGSVTAYTLS